MIGQVSEVLKIELTEELKPILLPLIEWKELFNPNYKVEESVDEAEKKQTRVQVPCLENGVVSLNDEDAEILKLYAACMEAKKSSEEIEKIFFAKFVDLKCQMCRKYKSQDSFAKDPSSPFGLKYVCKDCFNDRRRKKRSENLAQAREACRLRVKRWHEKNPEHAREKARLNSARYRLKKREERAKLLAE
jgi:hypothetical protein